MHSSDIKAPEGSSQGPEEWTRARLDVTWAGARDGLWDWDVGSNRMRVSRRWKEIIGYRDEEIGDSQDEWLRRVHPRDLVSFKNALNATIDGLSENLEVEFRMLHKDGSWRWIYCHGKRHGEFELLGGSITDVTSIKANENRLLHEAFHDSLTGLPNKRLFMDRLGLSLTRRSQREGQPVGVIYIDLDRFHVVNDSLGVETGDLMLMEVKERLTRCLRLGDTLGRLGGDKFAVLLDGIASMEDADHFAQDLQAIFAAPMHLGGHDVFTAASMGVALCTDEDESGAELLRNAITAMHHAKEDGAVPYQVFDPIMNEAAKDRLVMEADLNLALKNQEFVLHYQPIVSFKDGGLVAFEALVRWNHPERGLVRPDLFIPIAEETGLIVPLGKWVLEEACRQMHKWRKSFPGGREVRVAVNISARQMESPALIQEIVEALKDSGLDASGLDLELTESVVMGRTKENAARLQELRDMGIKLLIDDFGTGYSSLSHLRNFPIHALKIDRSFVYGMEFDSGKEQIVRTILVLAKSLGLSVVAEGIETVDALKMLRDLDCEHGQGYFFSAAMDGDSAEAWLENPPRW